MARDRRIPDSVGHYADDDALLRAVFEQPEDVAVWPAGGLDALGLTAGQQALVQTWRLDVEVRNGGFGEYFAALGAEALGTSAVALEALARLGATEHRRLLGEALARLDGGVPEHPDAARRRASGGPPSSEEQYEDSVRHLVIGRAGPDMDAVRERSRERRRWAAALHARFGELDDAYRTLGEEGRPLERYWAAYVRAHPGEFFSR